MRFYTETTGGPSPGITIAGTKEDLAKLGKALASAVNETPIRTNSDGSILLSGLEVHGDPWDWIAFQVEPNTDWVVEKKKKKDKRSCVYVAIFCALVVIVLTLAAKGFIAFFQ